jgi:hypothetical protein
MAPASLGSPEYSGHCESSANARLRSDPVVVAEPVQPAEPEEILAGVAEKERRILEIVEEMRGSLAQEKA